MHLQQLNVPIKLICIILFHSTTSYSHKEEVDPVIPALFIKISILFVDVISNTVFLI